MACLDTTLLVDLARAQKKSREAARQKIRELVERGEPLLTTRLNVAELWVGVERASDRAAELQKVQRVLAPIGILELDADAAASFGRIVGHLQSRGVAIGDMDALIAAIAVIHGQLLVTRNPEHFARVPGLRIEEY